MNAKEYLEQSRKIRQEIIWINRQIEEIETSLGYYPLQLDDTGGSKSNYQEDKMGCDGWTVTSEAKESLDWAISKLKENKGDWIRFKDFEEGYLHIKCSKCGQYWSIDGHAKIFKYCFNCGADMRGK